MAEPKHIHHAVIMAAGRGQRMAPLTELVPKPMAPIDGTTLIAKGIQNITQRLSQVHVTVGYKGAMLAKHVIELGVRSVINTEGQGNAWWVYNTLLKNLNVPIYVLTCDNIIDLDFSLLEKNYFQVGSPACMLVPVKPIDGLEGDYIVHEKGIVKKLDRHSPTDIYCSGVQILNPFRINQITKSCDDFMKLWTQLMTLQELKVSSVYPKSWISIDTVEHLEKARKSS